MANTGPTETDFAYRSLASTTIAPGRDRGIRPRRCCRRRSVMLVHRHTVHLLQPGRLGRQRIQPPQHGTVGEAEQAGDFHQ